MGVDAIAMVVDFRGGVQWANALTGSAVSSAFYFDAAVRINSGDFVIVGSKGPPAQSAGIVSRLTSSGNHVLTSQFGLQGYTAAVSIDKCRDGGYIIASVSRDYTTSYDSIVVMRFSSSNELLWTRSVDFGSAFVPRSVIAAHDNGYLVAGATTRSKVFGNRKSVLVKLSKGGSLLWANEFGKGGKFRDYTCGCCRDAGWHYTRHWLQRELCEELHV
jgi:hypothetical protein